MITNGRRCSILHSRTWRIRTAGRLSACICMTPCCPVGVGCCPGRGSLGQSQDLDRSREDVAGPTFGLDQPGIAWVGLELASQPQNLDVDAAVEHALVVHPAGGKELLAAQYLFR